MVDLSFNGLGLPLFFFKKNIIFLLKSRFLPISELY